MKYNSPISWARALLEPTSREAWAMQFREGFDWHPELKKRLDQWKKEIPRRSVLFPDDLLLELLEKLPTLTTRSWEKEAWELITVKSQKTLPEAMGWEGANELCKRHPDLVLLDQPLDLFYEVADRNQNIRARLGHLIFVDPKHSPAELEKYLDRYDRPWALRLFANRIPSSPDKYVVFTPKELAYLKKAANQKRKPRSQKDKKREKRKRQALEDPQWKVHAVQNIRTRLLNAEAWTHKINYLPKSMLEWEVLLEEFLVLLAESESVAKGFAWVLNLLCDRSPEYVAPALPRLFELYPEIRKDIDFELTFAKAMKVAGIPSGYEAQAKAMLCSWVKDPALSLKAKNEAVEAIGVLAGQRPDLREDLRAFLSGSIPESPVAFQNVVRRILLEIPTN